MSITLLTIVVLTLTLAAIGAYYISTQYEALGVAQSRSWDQKTIEKLTVGITKAKKAEYLMFTAAAVNLVSLIATINF